LRCAAYTGSRARLRVLEENSCRSTRGVSAADYPEEVWTALTAKYPIGRVGEPEGIANAVLFLASDEFKFITGLEMVVDGGYSIQ